MYGSYVWFISINFEWRARQYLYIPHCSIHRNVYRWTLCLSAAEVYSVKIIQQQKRSTQEENMDRFHCLKFQWLNNHCANSIIHLEAAEQWCFCVGFSWMCSTLTVLRDNLAGFKTSPQTDLGSSILFGNMLIQHVGDERRCSMMIRAMDLYSWALHTGGSTPQNLIFTRHSHKAIGKHAGLSTAQLHQELQQQVVKAKFLWSLSSSTKSVISGIDRGGRRGK